MSGGYGRAKRMLRFMAKYANGISEKKQLGIRLAHGRISFIHDYRYVRYVTADAELTPAPEAKAVDNGVAQ